MARHSPSLAYCLENFDFGAVFSPGAKVDLFTPLDLNLERNWGNILTLLGRLKPGVTIAQALDDANRVTPDMYFNTKYPETKGRYKGNLIPGSLKDYVTGRLRHSLIALWCAVGAILLIAGVNLSNLLLARAAARAKEFAVRGALGASRGTHRASTPHGESSVVGSRAQCLGWD